MSKSSNQGYEHKDATFKPLFLSIIVLFVITGLGLGVAAVFYNSLVKKDNTAPNQSKRLQVPNYQLETNPSADYKTFKAAQEEHLNNYGWVDAKNKKIHVPISVAMEKALTKGFEARETKNSDIIEVDVPLESGGMKKGLG